MFRRQPPLAAAAHAAAAALPTRWRVVLVLVLLSLTVLASACSLDRERLNEKREDLKAVCSECLTDTCRALCEYGRNRQPGGG